MDKNAKEFATDTTPEVITATRTDADIKAAVVVIQRWYRRHLSQRMLLESSEFHRLMQACVKDARNVVHQPGRFRFLAIVRCYLPHILFVLSTILGKIRNKSARAKRHLSIVEPGVEMENCKNQIATFNDQYNRVNKLLKKMGPESTTFRSGNLTDLRKLVRNAKTLFEELKSAEPDLTSLDKEMAIGINGIVPPPVCTRRGPKPSLNTEDLDWI